MNKKQNILLWYFITALMLVFSVGAVNGYGNLSETTWLLILLGVFALTSIVTTRGSDGLVRATFIRDILPAIVIATYLFTSFVVYKIRDNLNEVLPASVQLDAKGRLNDAEFRVSIWNNQNWKIKSVVVTASYVFLKESITPKKSVELSCYRRSEGYDSCVGALMFAENVVGGEFEWSIDGAKGKQTIKELSAIRIGLLILIFLYIPIGMILVLLTSARDKMDDDGANEAIWAKKFIFYTIVYSGGILFWPAFLNSWYSKSGSSEQVVGQKKHEPKNVLDELIYATYGNPPPLKSANLSDAIAFATDELLGGVVSRTEVTKIATELFESPMPYSTHDLAYAAAMNFFKAPERRGGLMVAQLMARAKILELLQEKKLNVHLAKAFEDKLYKDYKPT